MTLLLCVMLALIDWLVVDDVLGLCVPVSELETVALGVALPVPVDVWVSDWEGVSVLDVEAVREILDVWVCDFVAVTLGVCETLGAWLCVWLRVRVCVCD